MGGGEGGLEGRGVGEVQASLGVGMDEGESGCVEHEARGVVGLAIEHIAEDGRIQTCSGMDAELMGSAGDGLEDDASAVGFAAEDVVVGARGFALLMIDDLDGAVGDVGTEREVDGALGVMQRAVEEGGVLLVDDTILKLDGKGSLCLGGQSENQQTRCIHIKAMYDQRACSIGKELGDAQRYTVLFVWAFAGDGEHARGLGDHDE